jgi:DNA-binding beta-propeller fold protein YncE
MFALMRTVVFTVLSAGVLLAQNGFVYPNDDSFSAPNTVSLMAIQGAGSSNKVQSFNTGGMGNSGSGFDAERRLIISPDNRFVFASNAGSNDVSGFTIDTTTGNLSLIVGSPFSTGGSGCQGIGLAITPNTTFLFGFCTRICRNVRLARV